jgi:hypothetical protein
MRKLIITLLFNLREIEILESIIKDELERTRYKIFNAKYDTNINYEIKYDDELCDLLYFFTESK